MIIEGDESGNNKLESVVGTACFNGPPRILWQCGNVHDLLTAKNILVTP